MLAVLRRHKLIQLARCKFYTVGPLHTAMDVIIYWYSPVRSKRPVGREVAFTQVYSKIQPTGPEWVQNSVARKSEPEIGPVRTPTIPFLSEQKRQVQFSSTVPNCWVSTGRRKCISLTELVTLSQYIKETLFSCRCFFDF